MRPLFGFSMRATNVQKAFILNSLFLAVVTCFTFMVHDKMREMGYETESGRRNKSETASYLVKVVRYARFYALLILSTFVAGLITYWLLFVLFGFGGGMLAVSKSWLIQKKGHTAWITKQLYGRRHKRKKKEKREKAHRRSASNKK